MNWKVNYAVVLLMIVQGCQQPIHEEAKHELTYTHPESVIEAAALIENYDGYVLIDLRKEEDYMKGHLPNAHQIWRTDITDTSYAYGGMMPQRMQLEMLLGSMGITPNDTIVIYDDKAECDAARLWWVLKFQGHEQVKLLNGGLVAWKEAGGMQTTETQSKVESNYRFSNAIDSNIYMDFIGLTKVMQDTGSVMLLDTRTFGEFNGDTHKNGAATPGSIPHAINLDWAVAVDLNGNHKFRTAEELKSTYAGIGMNAQSPVVTYCHSGVRSAHTLFVLTQLLGYENVRNYDGSWTEWSHLNLDADSQ